MLYKISHVNLKRFFKVDGCLVLASCFSPGPVLQHVATIVCTNPAWSLTLPQNYDLCVTWKPTTSCKSLGTILQKFEGCPLSAALAMKVSCDQGNPKATSKHSSPVCTSPCTENGVVVEILRKRREYCGMVATSPVTGFQLRGKLALQWTWYIRRLRHIENTYCKGVGYQRRQLALFALSLCSYSCSLHVKHVLIFRSKQRVMRNLDVLPLQLAYYALHQRQTKLPRVLEYCASRLVAWTVFPSSSRAFLVLTPWS